MASSINKRNHDFKTSVCIYSGFCCLMRIDNLKDHMINMQNMRIRHQKGDKYFLTEL